MAAAQRARLEDELAALRDDVSQLRAAVSRGDDEPQGRRLFAGVEEAEAADVCAAPPPPRTAQERDVSLAEELRLAQESLRASQKLVERVTAERDGLLCRPTLHEWRDAQRAIAHLERRLAATTKTTTTMRRERELRKYLSTAELVGRDKLDFDLQLHALEDLPRSVATDVLREVCRDLELRDAEDVPPAVRKLATACEALPRLEAFARRVVALTFEAPRPIEACLDELKKWRAAVADAGDARKFRGRVADALRPLVPVDWKIDDDDEVARALAHVCSLAARARSDALAYRGADATLASTPDAVLTQILLHVKRLFAVKTVDGLVPCLEKVHANLHTLETFKRSVAHALVCGAETPAAALLDALDRRLERPDDGEESRDLQHEARDLQHEDE